MSKHWSEGYTRMKDETPVKILGIDPSFSEKSARCGIAVISDGELIHCSQHPFTAATAMVRALLTAHKFAAVAIDYPTEKAALFDQKRGQSMMKNCIATGNFEGMARMVDVPIIKHMPGKAATKLPKELWRARYPEWEDKRMPGEHGRDAAIISSWAASMLTMQEGKT